MTSPSVKVELAAMAGRAAGILAADKTRRADRDETVLTVADDILSMLLSADETTLRTRVGAYLGALADAASRQQAHARRRR